MHLVVARHARALLIKNKASAEDPVRVFGFDRRGTADEPDLVATRRSGEKILDRAFAVALAHLHLVALVAADEVEVLRQRDQARSRRGGLPDQAVGRLEVGRHLGRRNHLQRRDLGLHWLFPCASTGCAWMPIFATLGSLPPPVTE